ncbi:unnamed protein product [Vicia faba]|uniref:Uncharacterized protein n=1 Tax=Vicia faba TaxID=3906 RepID=A0AAV1AQH6_VICFA|nr:unnamed protein product [Vicia faba]
MIKILSIFELCCYACALLSGLLCREKLSLREQPTKTIHNTNSIEHPLKTNSTRPSFEEETLRLNRSQRVGFSAMFIIPVIFLGSLTILSRIDGEITIDEEEVNTNEKGKAKGNGKGNNKARGKEKASQKARQGDDNDGEVLKENLRVINKRVCCQLLRSYLVMLTTYFVLATSRRVPWPKTEEIDMKGCMCKANQDSRQVQATINRETSGRLKKKRNREVGEMVMDKTHLKLKKHGINCNRFHKNGHNKVTCKLPQPQAPPSQLHTNCIITVNNQQQRSSSSVTVQQQTTASDINLCFRHCSVSKKSFQVFIPT